ncbi:hypothetical protein BH10ACT6_BH10ACT6_01240 [soil metagenome]
MTRAISALPLTAVYTRRTEWIYADRIPLRTGTILAGQGGIAKSTIISDIIARATRGELPGTFHGRPIAVGIISPEDDDESVLVPRLLAAGADLSLIYNLSTVVVTEGEKSWKTLPSIAEDLQALGRLITQNSIRLLVVDPLVSIMSGNSISQSDVRRNFDPLSSMAADLEFALLAVAHFGKTGEKAGDRLSGSHAFRDVARSLIVAAVDDETDARVLTVEKSNYSPLQPSDAYRIDSVNVRLHDGYTQSIGRAVLIGDSRVSVQDILDRDRDRPALSSDMSAVVDLVNAHADGVTVAQAIEALPGIAEATVRRYLTRASQRGQIERSDRGLYVPCPNVLLSQPPKRQKDIKTHFLSGHICPKCGEPSDPVNAPFDYIHPDCMQPSDIRDQSLRAEYDELGLEVPQ